MFTLGTVFENLRFRSIKKRRLRVDGRLKRLKKSPCSRISRDVWARPRTFQVVVLQSHGLFYARWAGQVSRAGTLNRAGSGYAFFPHKICVVLIWERRARRPARLSRFWLLELRSGKRTSPSSHINTTLVYKETRHKPNQPGNINRLSVTAKECTKTEVWCSCRVDFLKPVAF